MKNPYEDEDIEGDMTPMIDCVFQLIMFFILITDMSQKELEQLYLPKAEVADPDKPDPKEIRPIVNILSDGSIWIKAEEYYNPETDGDNYQRVLNYLQDQVQLMEKEPLNDDGTGPMVPANPLLVRADQSTPAHHIQKVMEVCGTKGIQIWKVQLAAAEVSDDKGAEE